MEILVAGLGISTSALGAYNLARMLRDRAKKARARMKALVEARKAAKARDVKIDAVIDRVETLAAAVVGKLDDPAAVKAELLALLEKRLNAVSKKPSVE